MGEFQYHCYRCGGHNAIQIDIPKGPDYAHTGLQCKHCGDGTHVLLSACPSETCEGYVYWINDFAIPDMIKSLARYFVHNLQTVIDKAAMKGFNIGIDTTEKFTLNAGCSCGRPLLSSTQSIHR